MEDLPTEWVPRCAVRLRRQWWTVDLDQLQEVAEVIASDERLRELNPEEAAEQWLRKGIPNVDSCG